MLKFLGFVTRDLGDRSWVLLLVNVTIMVMILSSIGAVTARLESAVTLTQSNLLGGHVLLSAPFEFSEQAEELLDIVKAKQTVDVSRQVAFTTMLYGSQSKSDDEQAALTAMRAVDAQWPLQGEVLVRNGIEDQALKALATGPKPGEIWLDIGSVHTLGLALGDLVELGDIDLKLAKVLHLEPDRGNRGGISSLIPKGVMNLQDVQSAGVVIEGSRSQWFLAVSLQEVNASSLQQLEEDLAAWSEDVAFSGRVRSRTTVETSSDRVMANTRGIIGLGGALAVLLAAAAVGMAARSYSIGQMQAIAMLKILGATSSWIIPRYALSISILLSLASMLGYAVGWISQKTLCRSLVGTV